MEVIGTIVTYSNQMILQKMGSKKQNHFYCFTSAKMAKKIKMRGNDNFVSR